MVCRSCRPSKGKGCHLLSRKSVVGLCTNHALQGTNRGVDENGAYLAREKRTNTVIQVIAQLVIYGKHYGIHNFIVPIRGEDHRPLPGVRCAP